MPHGHAPLQLFPWLVKHERSEEATLQSILPFMEICIKYKLQIRIFKKMDLKKISLDVYLGT